MCDTASELAGRRRSRRAKTDAHRLGPLVLRGGAAGRRRERLVEDAEEDRRDGIGGRGREALQARPVAADLGGGIARQQEHRGQRGGEAKGPRAEEAEHEGPDGHRVGDDRELRRGGGEVADEAPCRKRDPPTARGEQHDRLRDEDAERAEQYHQHLIKRLLAFRVAVGKDHAASEGIALVAERIEEAREDQEPQDAPRQHEHTHRLLRLRVARRGCPRRRRLGGAVRLWGVHDDEDDADHAQARAEQRACKEVWRAAIVDCERHAEGRANQSSGDPTEQQRVDDLHAFRAVWKGSLGGERRSRGEMWVRAGEESSRRGGARAAESSGTRQAQTRLAGRLRRPV
eukprot:3757212-Prymnesium_polylepis.1